MKTLKNIATAIYFYIFVWKNSDLSIFTKNEKFELVCKGELKAE
jgi:hypothetical protein